MPKNRRKTSMSGLRSIRITAVIATLVFAACSAPQSPTPVVKADAPAKAAYKKLDLTYNKPAIVGSEVRVAAAELPAGRTVELQWGTVTGGWVIEDYYHFKGKKYTETTSSLGKFNIDATGRLDARFTIPEDYG